MIKAMVLEKTHTLVLHNDEENDFLYVMAALVRFCDHERDQAEQCAIITHNVGKCAVKNGTFLDIYELKSNLDEIGLKVEIEDYAGDLH
jgi:ATP-dependent Clp protease adaptor protein ClpS